MASINLGRIAATLVVLAGCIAAPVLLRGQLASGELFQVRAGGSYLGLRLREVDADLAKSLGMSEVTGVEVAAVQQDQAADQAGIRPGDVILSYNGEKVLGAQQFIRLVSETPPGRKVHIDCWRAGNQRDFLVTTGSQEQVFTINEFPGSQVIDVPVPLMVWRNLILGIDSEDLSSQMAQTFGVKQGILIRSVTPSSLAQHAGLRAGDILTGFCGKPLNSPRELGQILKEFENSQKALAVQYTRDHKAMTALLSPDPAH